MRILSKKTFPLLLVGALGAVVLVVLISQADLMTRWKIHSAVDDVVQGRNLQKALVTLNETPRGPTIEALKETLEEEDGTPWGKVNVLQQLWRFKEERVVMRAISSDVLTTRRAAAYLRQGYEEDKARAADIALEWLKDEDASDRHLAALILRTADRRDAVPDLIAVLRNESANPGAARTIVHVLGALAKFKPDGIAPDVMKLARDKDAADRVRTEAFRVLTQLDDAPREELKSLLLEVAQDGGTETFIRHAAVSLLGAEENASEEGWEVLKQILFDEDIDDGIFQRSALRALGKSYPLEKMHEILLDRRVYTHDYYPIRTDVASGLGNLREYVKADEKSRSLALTVLALLMEDRDPKDIADDVPRQAWLAHWQLCESILIPDEYKDARRLFTKVPKPYEKEEHVREYMFAFLHGNLRISKEQTDALSFCAVTEDDVRNRRSNPEAYERSRLRAEKMAARIAEMMRNHVGACLEKMAADAGEKGKGAGEDPDESEKDGDD